jgi:hypothetical protein
MVTHVKPLSHTTWGAAKKTENDVQGQYLYYRTPPLLEHHETSMFDSGCNGHFFLINAPCQNKVKSQNPLRVRLPNGDTMDSTHRAYLEIPELSKSASIAHILPGMENHSLLSVGQLCTEGYYVTFRIDAVIIYSSAGKSILKGKRDLNTGPRGKSFFSTGVRELTDTRLRKEKYAAAEHILLIGRT